MSSIGILRRATGRSVDILMDKSGAANFDYPMNSIHAEQIVPYSTGIIAERFNWRSTLARQLAGLPGQVWDQPWSGYVLPIDEDITGNKMKVSCVGWLERFKKRVAREKKIWTNTDDGAIILDIVSALGGINVAGPSYVYPNGTTTKVAPDGYTVRWPAGSFPNVPGWVKRGALLPNEGAGGPTAYVALADRDLTIEKYEPLFPHIEQLCDLENSCDIKVDPVTRETNVYRRYRRDKPEVVLGFQWGPRNIGQMSRRIDADQKINYILGRGAPGTTPQFAHNTADMDVNGPIEEVADLGSVKKNEVLLAYAGAELIVRGNGQITYGITPFAHTSENGVPEPLVDYREGDLVRATAKHEPRIAIEAQGVRVFGFRFGIDDDTGDEKLNALELSP